MLKVLIHKTDHTVLQVNNMADPPNTPGWSPSHGNGMTEKKRIERVGVFFLKKMCFFFAFCSNLPCLVPSIVGF